MCASKPPVATATEVAAACGQGLRNPDLRERIRADIGTIQENSVAYQGFVKAGTLNRITPDDFSLAHLSTDEVKYLYKTRLAKPGSSARRHYDALLASAPHGRCVYCMDGIAATLDHFAPQTHFGTLAIEPWNLVPCCYDCNVQWGSNWAERARGAALHPYAMPDVGRWLHARIEWSTGPVVKFYTEPPDDVDQALSEHIASRFAALALDRRYSGNSAVELAFLRAILENFNNDVPETAKYLAELAEFELRANQNGWRGAMFESIASEPKYLDYVIHA